MSTNKELKQQISDLVSILDRIQDMANNYHNYTISNALYREFKVKHLIELVKEC